MAPSKKITGMIKLQIQAGLDPAAAAILAHLA